MKLNRQGLGVALLAIACGAAAIGAVLLGYQDIQIISGTPANPASGYLRFYANTGTLKCRTSSGADCLAAQGTAGGDLSGTFPNPTVGKVNGGTIPLSAAVVGTNSSRQFLASVASNIISLFSGSCSGSTWLDGSGACSAPSGLSPGGSASGDLSGTYPGPTVSGVGGAAVPTSAALTGTNASKQLIAAAATALASIFYVGGGGTGNAQTASFAQANTSLNDGLTLCWKPTAANSSTTPTFAPDGLTAHTIVKAGGNALAANDIITTALACAIYNTTGTHWELQNPQTGLAGTGTVTSVGCGTGMTGGTITTTGTCNVASSLPSTTSVNGTTIPSSATLTQTIGSGTITMNPGAIASGACSTAGTLTVTGTATTDTIVMDFNADPTSTTGFSPTSNGMLTFIKWPTSNTVNVKECNNTASSVTPGSIVLNVRVTR